MAVDKASSFAQNFLPPSVTLKLGAEVGVGSFGRVYSAVEQPDGRVVAVKKSRVSIKVSRTLLRYEAHILCLLRGHPAIPEIYAWGHLEHFEYISMELLGEDLNFDKQDLESRTSSVALIASQMISALQHVHSHGIIHRDVKPDNMLPRLTMPFQIQLIDFGIARTVPDLDDMGADDDSVRSVVGTITYASLNAHLGVPLTRRDDFESLAYTLFEFLREDGLPWDKHYPRWATAAFVRRQMHEGKRAWSGERLVDGYDATFGVFLEEVRAMKFGAIPDYRAWEQKFSELVKSPVELLDVLSTNEVSNVNKAPEPQRSQEPPVQAGQLVYVRILPKASIEGFPSSRGPICEWQDPTLSDMAWPTTFLPAIVLSVSLGFPELWSVSLLALTRHKPDSKPTTRILVRGDGNDEESVTVVGEGWPEGDLWCDNQYVINTFLWTPDQDVPLPSHWSISPSDLQLLVDKLGKPDPKHGLLSPRQLWSLDEQYLFVEGKPLSPATLDLGTADWNSRCAWLADITPISARWAHDARRAWSTCDESPAEVNYLLSDSISSYCEDDYEDWLFPLREREKSATLGEEREALLEALIGKIERVL